MPMVSDVKKTGEDQFLVQVGEIGFRAKPVGNDRMYIYAASKLKELLSMKFTRFGFSFF